MSNEMTQQNTDGALAVCLRKKNDKTPVVFYADRMNFKGETILYSDVESISITASHTAYSILFEVYSGICKLRLKDGRKLKWKTGSWGLFGINGIKRKKGYFAQFYAALLATVAKKVSADYISQIKLGGTVKIGGITLTPTEISGKRAMKSISLPYSEIAGANVYSCNVYINKKEKNRSAFNAIPLNVNNAICLLYIVNSLVGVETNTDASSLEGGAPAEE
ncbi:MAG: hypothetical protein J5872_01050 [Lachnospiraceae bacterium]|nr:hypothetical protein [Lachnospiraceae bacterium]